MTQIKKGEEVKHIDKIVKMLKEKKRVILMLLFVLLTLFVYTIYTKYKIANPDTPYTIVHIEQRDIAKTIIVSGEVVSESEVELGSDVSGQITQLYVNVGQTVQKGEIIARVENSTQRAQVVQTLGALGVAKAQVNTAEVQLQKTSNGATREEKVVAASQVEAAEVTLSSSHETARNALQDVYAGTVSVLSFGTDTMMNNATSVNPTLSFQTTEYSARIATENMRIAVGDILVRHHTASAHNLINSELRDELQKTKEELVSLREITSSLLRALGGAITTSTVTNATITTYTNTVNAVRAQVLADIVAITNAESGIRIAETAMSTALGNEAKVVNGVRKEDIDIAKVGIDSAAALVLSASGNYQLAQSTLSKTSIRSPLSGVIVSLYKEVGEFVSSATPLVKVSSESKYISALVSEVDIAKVHTGMEVTIKLDAFADKIFTGTVDFIYPDKQEDFGIVYYELKVSFNGDVLHDFTILPGMSLDVVIPYEVKEGVYAIERSIAKKDNGTYFVQVVNLEKVKPIDDKFSRIFFESGFVGDEYVEVLSGLTPDIEVVKFSTELEDKN